MNDPKQRFLTAYSECRTIAGAARMVHIHRATVYRWKADLGFAAAMERAWRAGYERWYRAEYLPQAAARRAAHERRNAELRPLRQHLAARPRSQADPALIDHPMQCDIPHAMGACERVKAQCHAFSTQPMITSNP
jgi:hypothetical protein